MNIARLDSRKHRKGTLICRLIKIKWKFLRLNRGMYEWTFDNLTVDEASVRLIGGIFCAPLAKRCTGNAYRLQR